MSEKRKPIPALLAYYDDQWGKPIHDDQKLFELLSLEIFHAGLNWTVLLEKEAELTKDFKQWDIQKVADLTDGELDQILADPKMIRNNEKVHATRNNAQAILNLEQSNGSFSNYLWSFVDNKPIINHYPNRTDVPRQTPLADRISGDMKQHGFFFVGDVVVETFLEDADLIQDDFADPSQDSDQDDNTNNK
ncbi:methyladenine glycosylase family protein [Lactobacillus selangorensis]|uniref:Methyladenine glycosylase family protein n=1 Tax=Lactobacillus selangorensis TaxID=81857 RepID=A0A0R2FGC1_9LACO|nr:DNA-3-methyladenine glycosylase I [Lactobacillus selangorensis]KRN27666.1 methyladenine glycosylase family protein [Lactobacillus selangorensis]KRN30367.1 methyladenine glycosylase family protein [Lactobacillus selangorensis]